jgi:hypothetical protein
MTIDNLSAASCSKEFFSVSSVSQWLIQTSEKV